MGSMVQIGVYMMEPVCLTPRLMAQLKVGYFSLLVGSQQRWRLVFELMQFLLVVFLGISLTYLLKGMKQGPHWREWQRKMIFAALLRI